MLIGFSGPRLFKYLTCRMLKTYSRKRRQENKIIEDVHELCRLCLARADEAVPIFGELDNACAALPMRIMICVGHEVSEHYLKCEVILIQSQKYQALPFFRKHFLIAVPAIKVVKSRLRSSCGLKSLSPEP